MKKCGFMMVAILIASVAVAGLSFVLKVDHSAEGCGKHSGMSKDKHSGMAEGKSSVVENSEGKIKYYTCPMHAEERGVENGKCSECGMNLVAKTAEMQTTCPIMGGKINANLYSDHEGLRVHFCCGGCKPKFESNPAQYIKKLRDAGVEPSPVPKNDK